MRRRVAILVSLGLLAACAIPAQAELTQQGKLVVGFDGSLAPQRLPRYRPSPVAVTVSGDVRTVKGAPLPQLRRISVAINRAGRLYDKGLGICRVRSIQPSTEAAAYRICGDSIVGHGHVTVEVKLENQAPFPVSGSLLAFNGPRGHGSKLILAQVYTAAPPGAFVLKFKLRRRSGLYGTEMTTVLPARAFRWARLTHFDMTLHRVYRYRGKWRSLVSAACAAPDGFPGAVFPFARATYGFDTGQRLTTTVIRSCKVRD